MPSLLVVGATGLFGQAFMAEGKKQGLDVVGAARRDADIAMDLGDQESIETTIASSRPDIVVNTAAMIDIGGCEANPDRAHKINAEAPGRLAKIALDHGARTVQISTDHFYTGDGTRPHREDEPVVLLNEYARTKLAGENSVLEHADTLVVRTNILGFRGWEKPTFAEWSLSTVLEDRPVTLFADSFISAIDVRAGARAILKLALGGAGGLVNVGCREVYSKKDLIKGLAEKLGRKLTNARSGSVRQLEIRRGESLGLDVGLAEKLLGYKLPNMNDVLDAIVSEGKARHAI